MKDASGRLIVVPHTVASFRHLLAVADCAGRLSRRSAFSQVSGVETKIHGSLRLVVIFGALATRCGWWLRR